ncbi:hypothetical protein WME92_37020 [Sorangium sp. So ce307]
MLLTLTTTHRPATDLGYLLVKNPARTQSFSLSFGKAHVFYPEATEERCTAALLLDVDPVDLVRGRGAGDPGTLAQYVNDRPYVASSFLSVAIAQVFGSALGGKCRHKPELPSLQGADEARRHGDRAKEHRPLPLRARRADRCSSTLSQRRRGGRRTGGSGRRAPKATRSPER